MNTYTNTYFSRKTKAKKKETKELVPIRGEVSVLFFSSPQFSAGRLRTTDGKTVSFAGSLMVQLHDPVILYGNWEYNKKFGPQFKVDYFEFNQKLDSEGLVRYLTHHPNFKGIGEIRAQKIVDSCGFDFDRLIDEQPDSIAKATKIPLEKIQIIREEWLRNRLLNSSMTWLASYGLTHHQMTTLIKKFGNSIVTVLKTDPYVLIREIKGFGFQRVDSVARKMGTDKDDPSRIRAGIVHCVTERVEQGDCWVDYVALIEQANSLLKMDSSNSRITIEKALDELINEGILYCTSLGGRFLVALPQIHKMEIDISKILTDNSKGNSHFVEGEKEKILEDFKELNTQQQQALLAAVDNNLILISGGAGVGKTYTISAIYRLYKKLGLEIVMAAPTGKAAKRIEQVVGHEAFTIHRLLKFNGCNFALGPDNPIQADLVIIDEVSMMDVRLTWHLFKAIDWRRTSVVLVGDHNQLPPIGPGNLLRDLIERRPIPTIILDHVVRQAGVLKENSISILSGVVKKTARKDKDGHRPWVITSKLNSAAETQAYVLDLFENVLSEDFKFDLLHDVQLLSPIRGGLLGVDTLNRELQRLLQKKLWGVDVVPVSEQARPRLLVHDRVIQTRNNYDLGVMNGAIGVVTSVGPRSGELRVRFDDSIVEYQSDTGDARDLSLAYALTFHKVQGDQFPCAVVIVHKSHSYMHHRNLFYTGVTRAQKTAIVVGDAWGIRNCAIREEVERRKTFLSILELPKL